MGLVLLLGLLLEVAVDLAGLGVGPEAAAEEEDVGLRAVDGVVLVWGGGGVGGKGEDV